MQTKKDKLTGDSLGVGRRKSSVARVRVRAGSGNILINSRTLPEPLWWAGLTVASFCKDGETAIHMMSEDYPGYDRDNTERKAQQSLKNAKWALSDEPIDASCPCEVCQRHSRGYIRHLFQVGEPTAARLLSLHNIAWTIDLMRQMRVAIAAGTFQSLRAQVLAVWG